MWGWWAGPWGPCSLSCGGGQQTRGLRCLRKVTYQREEAAPPALCPGGTPARVQPCLPQACPPQWSTGAWSQCSKTCGRGLRKRSVFCRSPAAGPGPPGPVAPAVAVLPDSMCPRPLRPKAQETCVLRRCPRNERLQWAATPWGECSASCGPGVQKRALGCGEREPQGRLLAFPLRRCRNLPRPPLELQQVCSRGPCAAPPARTPPLPSGPVVLGCILFSEATPKLVAVALAEYQALQNSAQCPAVEGSRRAPPSVSVRVARRPAAMPTSAPPPPGLATPTFAPPPARPRARPPRHCQSQCLWFCSLSVCGSEVAVSLSGEQCVDLFSWCPLVPQHRVCKHHFYGQQCCKSCRGGTPQ
ncbi:unnamed protein product [Boreogadus saida]